MRVARCARLRFFYSFFNQTTSRPPSSCARYTCPKGLSSVRKTSDPKNYLPLPLWMDGEESDDLSYKRREAVLQRWGNAAANSATKAAGHLKRLETVSRKTEAAVVAKDHDYRLSGDPPQNYVSQSGPNDNKDRPRTVKIGH